MGKFVVSERFSGSVFDVEHETEFSNPEVIVIERTNGDDKMRIELPKDIEAGLVLEIVQSVLTV